MDDAGKIVREVKVASEPEALLKVLTNPAYHFKRIGLEAGPLSQWLLSVFAEAGLPAICVETRQMRAALKAQAIAIENDLRGTLRNFGLKVGVVATRRFEAHQGAGREYP